MLSVHVAGVCLLLGVRLFCTGRWFAVHVCGMWMTVIASLYAAFAFGCAIPLVQMPEAMAHFARGCLLGSSLVCFTYLLEDCPAPGGSRWPFFLVGSILLAAYLFPVVPALR